MPGVRPHRLNESHGVGSVRSPTDPCNTAMRWATYERWVAKYDAAEEMLDAQLAMAAARLMRKFGS